LALQLTIEALTTNENMKKYFLISLLILCFSNYGQIKSGIVTYGVTVVEDKDSQIDKLMLSMNVNYYSIIKEFDFTLKFSSDKALFSETEKMYSDTEASNLGKVKINYLGRSLIKNDTIYSEGTSRSIGNYISKKKVIKDWILLNETKLIGNYKCYKATCDDIVVNKINTFRHPIIAWYCPEIPFPFGPLGYGGLPGLILELQTKNGVYGAKKIQLNTDGISIENLKAYRVLEIEKLNELIEKKNSN
jgi:GLPGLI family protein